jgi:hypothetical protein
VVTNQSTETSSARRERERKTRSGVAKIGKRGHEGDMSYANVVDGMATGR